MMPSKVIPFSSAQAHYDQLLAEHYDWMFGMSLEVKVAEQQALLNEIAGRAGNDDLAVDLGCGSGFQSLALSSLGYRVVALDTSRRLLDMLATSRHADGPEVGGRVDGPSPSLSTKINCLHVRCGGRRSSLSCARVDLRSVARHVG